MARSIHIRLDAAAAAALEIVRADSTSDSEAVRTALREAASRRRTRASIATEVAALASDQEDIEEMRAVRRELDALAPTEIDDA